MDIFPIIQPEIYKTEKEVERANVNADVLWDENGPRVINGQPVIASGIDSVIGWARRCLMTKKNDYVIFSAAYGCDIDGLIGRGYQRSTIEAEAIRIITEALKANEFITAVTDVDVDFKGSTLKISCRIKTEDEEAIISV